MKIFGYTPAQVRKSLITALGFIVAILTAATQGDLVPADKVAWVLSAVGAITSFLVWLVKNAPLEPAQPVVPPVPAA